MTIVGMNFSTNSNGERVTTLHVTTEFDSYYSDRENGRGCAGKKVESIYVGNYDCSELSLNQEIEVYYDKAIVTKKGAYQPVKYIEIKD